MTKVFNKYTPIYVKKIKHYECVALKNVYKDENGYFVTYKGNKTYVEPLKNELGNPAFEIVTL